MIGTENTRQSADHYILSWLLNLLSLKEINILLWTSCEIDLNKSYAFTDIYAS